MKAIAVLGVFFIASATAVGIAQAESLPLLVTHLTSDLVDPLRLPSSRDATTRAGTGAAARQQGLHPMPPLAPLANAAAKFLALCRPTRPPAVTRASTVAFWRSSFGRIYRT